MKELPTEVILPSGVKLPENFYDGIYEYLQDKYGREVDKYPEAYGIEIKITDISWNDL